MRPISLRAHSAALLLATTTVAAALTAGLATAPAHAQSAPFQPEVLASGLSNPWAVAFIDNGRMLVTERPGRLRVVEPQGPDRSGPYRIGEPIEGVPPVAAGGQGGLLDVVPDSQFAQNRRIYLCYSEPEAGGSGNSTALATAVLSADARRLEQVQVLFSQKPKVASRQHFGCRIVEAPDGHLFLTLGDRGSRMEDAQDLGNHIGKVVRIRKDGSVPPDNPFVGRAGAQPEIWSYGHRNAQGATWGPDNRLWLHEHGPQGGDEINRPEASKNYGWPVITYGERYGGGAVTTGITQKAGMEQPLHQWTPSIAPSGMVFLTSDRYGAEWKNHLFVGSLKFRHLARLEVKDGRVVREERLLENLRERIRDVRQGPDGLLYVLTDSGNGQIIRLAPR
ncbi:MAG: PQQ-dependent sugar dehydrogenase [Serpentinimonas sp.]|jgi:glucose/arabinose dehydrogenase|nr:PQQ-dependent sugar dehydrogenase [Serpentinimonas sp.]